MKDQVRDQRRFWDVQQFLLYKKPIENTLKDKSLAKLVSLLYNLSLVDLAAVPYVYSIFTFEPLHNLFLGFTELVKDVMLQYLSPHDLSTYPNGRRSKQQMLSSVRTSALRGTNALLS